MKPSAVIGAGIATLTIALALAVGGPSGPVPAAANIETGAKHGSLASLDHGVHVRGIDRRVDRADDPRLTRDARMRRIIRHIWPNHSEDEAIRVFRCESNLNPRAVGDHGTSYGLSQIHWTVHRWAYKHHPAELFRPWHNLRMALRLYRANGWQPWTCARILGIR